MKSKRKEIYTSLREVWEPEENPEDNPDIEGEFWDLLSWSNPRDTEIVYEVVVRKLPFGFDKTVTTFDKEEAYKLANWK